MLGVAVAGRVCALSEGTDWEELHEACHFIIRARLRAGGPGVRAAPGQAGTDGQCSVPHPGLFQRLHRLAERQYSTRAQHRLPYPLRRLSVGELDAGLTDKSDLRL